MVQSKNIAGVMQIERFAPFDGVDFLRGRSGGWSRQIAFLKSRYATGANFFVIRDDLSRGATGTWRLFLAADRVELHDDRAVAIGREDVDTDIFFLTGRPADLSTEVVTRTSASSFYNKPHATTQTALVAGLRGTRSAIAILIYPRLKGLPSPKVRAEHGGRLVRVETGTSFHTVLVSREAQRLTVDGVTVEGTLAAVTEEPGRRFLALGDKGRVSAFGRILEASSAAYQPVAP